mmetsp:Transcript_91228/g.284287  ORF Transcript_91228/g.284287 Transcript_91228/m.284287 type:complete len:150 (-) Transcript_91228:97-546(-)
MEGFQVVTTGTNVSVTTGSVVGEVGIFTSDTGSFNVFALRHKEKMGSAVFFHVIVVEKLEGIKVGLMQLLAFGYVVLDGLDVIVLAVGWHCSRGRSRASVLQGGPRLHAPDPCSAGSPGNWKEAKAYENNVPMLLKAFKGMRKPSSPCL